MNGPTISTLDIGLICGSIDRVTVTIKSCPISDQNTFFVQADTCPLLHRKPHNRDAELILFDCDWNAQLGAHPVCNKSMSDTYPVMTEQVRLELTTDPSLK